MARSNASRPPREIGAVLTEFASVMAGSPTVDDVLNRLGNYCSELLPVNGAGVLLVDPDTGGLVIGTANSDIGQSVERIEADLGEGPCTDSLRTAEQILVPDLEAAADIYPQFVPRALDAGARGIHALPLSARAEPLGSLDLVTTAPVHLTHHQLNSAQMLADVAVAYLTSSRILASTSRLAEQLQHALDSRVVIEQAKGLLAERHGITVTEAFERLRTHARTSGSKLRDVAGEVIGGTRDL